MVSFSDTGFARYAFWQGSITKTPATVNKVLILGETEAI
jgi:hypothetical protein